MFSVEDKVLGQWPMTCLAGCLPLLFFLAGNFIPLWSAVLLVWLFIPNMPFVRLLHPECQRVRIMFATARDESALVFRSAPNRLML